MENREKPPFPTIVKTPKQIQAQTRLMDLHSRNRNPSLPQDFLDDPQGFRAGLKSFNETVYEERISKETFFRSETLNKAKDFRDSNHKYIQYQMYLDALRELRYEESTQSTLPTKDENGSLVENYLAQKSFSPMVAEGVLTSLNKVDYYTNTPILTPAELKQATQSDEAFKQAAKKVFSKRGFGGLMNMYLARSIFPDNEFKEVFERQANGFFLRENFEFFKHLFTPEEQKNLLTIVTDPEDMGNILRLLNTSTDARALFTEAEIRDLAINSYKGGRGNSLSQIDKDKDQFYLSRADVESIAVHRMQNFQEVTGFDFFLRNYLQTDEEQQKFTQQVVHAYSDKALGKDLYRLSTYEKALSESDYKTIFENVFQRDPKGALGSISLAERKIPLEEAARLINQALHTPGLEIPSTAISGLFGAKSISGTEKIKITDKIIASGDAYLLVEGIARYSVQVPEESRGEFLEKILKSAPIRDVMGEFSSWYELVDDSLLKTLLDKASFDSRAFSKLFEMWGLQNKLSPALLKQVIGDNIETQAHSIVFEPNQLLEWFPRRQAKKFYDQAVAANPAAFLDNTSRGWEEDRPPFRFPKKEKTIEDALNDEARISMAPKLLTAGLNELAKDKPLSEQPELLQRLTEVYSSLALIRKYGFEEKYRQIQENGVNTAKQEQELISSFSCLVVLKITHPELNLPNEFGNSLEEIKNLLLTQIPNLLELPSNLSNSDVNHFYGIMETPLPFITYVLQYKDQPTHRKILGEIFTSITQGRFAEWKYGPRTEENLEELKNRKLLPPNLNFDQYEMWRTDQESTLFEALSTNAREVSNTLRNYIDNNINHLEIEGVIDLLKSDYPDQDVLSSLPQEMAKTGQELAKVNRELSELRKSEPQSSGITELEERKASLENTRNQLVRARKVFRFSNIRPEEVVSGYFLEGKDNKKKGESIQKVLEALKGSSEMDNEFVYDFIESQLDAIHQQTEGSQNLVCTDSSDPKIWLEVGEIPVGSCQSYDSGAFNQCLIGYTDPNSKILVLRNERGNIVGRSIMRLLETKDGDPTIHVETIYKSFPSLAVDRSIYTRASQKAQAMGIKCVVSKRSQNEQGATVESSLPDGYKTIGIDYYLYSNDSRSPSVYVDAVGGEQYQGKYEMKDLLEFEQQ